jgi:hypothetical protein
MIEEEISHASLFPFPFFEDFLLGALGGPAEQTATTTAGIFLSTLGGRE